ncbi:MAG: bifunctional diaminohydroxyphosphoribosylaminopyrimidine deaminase/5-amino-6-(5-phosphoribosylamino)uracil reductase RibD [Pseudomonadales bacterium]
MFSHADHQFMSRALQLARKALFITSPNPAVGCVLVKDGRVIGEGWTQPAGGPHAEICALNRAGDEAKGATAYVTLEPCSHHGRTPPCCDALLAAGVSRVVAALQDPHHRVSGAGLQRLKHNGVEVECGLYGEQARQINVGFCSRMERGLPRVRLKLAVSLDGRTAMASGESQWITGPESRYQVQRLRAASCAIITGVASVIADDSALTVRPDEWIRSYPASQVRQPLRVVLDSQLRLPIEAKILQSQAKTLIVCVEADETKRLALEQAGAEVLVLASENDQVELAGLLRWLAQEKECNEVLVEAGATVAGSFIAQGLVDELHVFQAPILLGSSARPMADFDLQSMSQKHEWQIRDSRRLGQDQWLILSPGG